MGSGYQFPTLDLFIFGANIGGIEDYGMVLLVPALW